MAVEGGIPQEPGQPARSTVERALRAVSGVTVAGAALGLLVGGVGGRLAMRVLFLTSTSVRGIRSDDGFIIGRFSIGDTLNLLVVATVIGMLGAYAFLAVRPFLIGPRWFRSLTCALGAGAVVGAMLVQTDGVDFTLLSPRWLAIALFVAVPALFAALIGPAVERVLRPHSWFGSARRGAAFAPLILCAVPPVIVVAPVAVAGFTVAWTPGSSPRAWTQSQTFLWLARAALLAIAGWGAAALARDIAILI